MLFEKKKRILIFSRENITNYGDPIIAECCKYLIEKVAKERKQNVQTTIMDIFEENIEKLSDAISNHDVVVFPGGGVNSTKVNRIILNIVIMAKEAGGIPVHFNAIGILRVNPNPKNQKLLAKIFDKKVVKQVTTRGDLEELNKIITKKKKYPSKWVYDPGMWANETYKIEKDKNTEAIGVGIIRPDIFSDNGNDFSEEDVFNMYENIIRELQVRNYKWRLFTNGMKKDYNFGVKLLKRMKLDVKTYLDKNVQSKEELVKEVAKFKAVIAARMHANIIATSLDIPSVGLVWNDKLNIFGSIAGCPDRYIGIDNLLNGSYIVDKMEQAMAEGYNYEHINRVKKITLDTIKNIIF